MFSQINEKYLISNKVTYLFYYSDKCFIGHKVISKLENEITQKFDQ